MRSKMKKYISAVLIYSLLVQMVLTNAGCTSFYPVTGELSNFVKYDNDIMLIMKDITEIEVPKNGVFFIEKERIDSSKTEYLNDDVYQIFWMKDKKKISFKVNTPLEYSSDTLDGYYFVLNKTNNEFKIVDKNDIAEIQEQKSDPTKNILLVCAIVVAISIAAALSVSEKRWDIPQIPNPSIY
jgi:hypothetical protein